MLLLLVLIVVGKQRFDNGYLSLWLPNGNQGVLLTLSPIRILAYVAPSFEQVRLTAIMVYSKSIMGKVSN